MAQGIEKAMDAMGFLDHPAFMVLMQLINAMDIEVDPFELLYDPASALGEPLNNVAPVIALIIDLFSAAFTATIKIPLISWLFTLITGEK